MKHLAVIMDGNGRWATERGMSRSFGHEQGAWALLRAIDAMEKYDIAVSSFYAFSTENSTRDEEEVGNILGVIAYFLSEKILPLAIERDYQIRIVGERALMPKELLSVVNTITEKTINNKGRVIVLAICYGGDAEITQAVNRALRRRARLNDVTDITVDEIRNNLYTASLPNPEVVVRYGGYSRLSNFMPMQTIYSELFFFDKYWPDFDETDVKEILDKYSNIKRNFGGNNA